MGLLGIGKHRRANSLLSAYIDDQVSPSEAAWVETHVADCDRCRRDLEGLRATVDLLRGLPELALPRSFSLEAAPDPVRAPRGYAWAPALAGAVAALLLVVLVVGDASDFLTQTGASRDLRSAASSVPTAPTPALEFSRSSPAVAELVERLESIPASSEEFMERELRPEPVTADGQSRRAAKQVVVEKEVITEVIKEAPVEAVVEVEVQVESEAEVKAEQAPQALAAAAAPESAETAGRAAPTDAGVATQAGAVEPEAAAVAEAETAESVVAALAAPSSDEAPEPEALGGGPGIGGSIDDEEGDGIAVPLRQLEIALGALAGLLLLAAGWLTVSRRRYP